MNKRIFFRLFLIFTFYITLGQKTSKEFGENFLINISSKDSLRITKNIPSPEKLIKFSNITGMKYNKEDISKLKKEYPLLVKYYYEGILYVIERGKEIGVDWKNIEFQNVKITSEGKRNELTFIDEFYIIFKSNEKYFKIFLSPLFEFEKNWFFIGDTNIIKM